MNDDKTPWDLFKEQQGNFPDNECTFQDIDVWRYEFINGERKGEVAFDLMRLKDGSWMYESDHHEKLFDDIDELIDFMRQHNIHPPLGSTK